MVNKYKELVFDKKTYWKILVVAGSFGSLTIFAAYKEHWTTLLFGVITLFFFGLLKVCTINKIDAEQKDGE